MKKKLFVNGFSLLELMVVVVIVGVLAIIAIPSYSSYITRSNRADGMSSLVLAANAMEQYRISNFGYTSDLSALPISILTPETHYSLLLESASNTSFVLVASPNGMGTSGRQVKDGALRLTSQGLKTRDCKLDQLFSCDWREN